MIAQRAIVAQRLGPEPGQSGSGDLIPRGFIFRQFPRRGHDQPFLGPRHGDIEQAKPFLQRGLFHLVQPGAHGLGHVIRRGFPDGGAVNGDDLILDRHIAPPGVGQDHDWRFQTLGTMHRHHPDLVRRAVDLTFDFQIIGLHPLQEPGQAGHRAALVRQRLAQHRVDPILGLWPQPREQFAAPIVAGEDAFDQIVGAQVIDLSAQVAQHGEGGGVGLGLVAQGLPEVILFTVMGEGEKLLFRPAEKWRFQRGGKR